MSDYQPIQLISSAQCQQKRWQLNLCHSSIATAVFLSVSVVGIWCLKAVGFSNTHGIPNTQAREELGNITSNGDQPENKLSSPSWFDATHYIVAQSTSKSPYCFNVEIETPVYSEPSFEAATLAQFEEGDTAYATTNPPTSYWFTDGTADGNSFVEVAIYDGGTGWIPRFPEGEDTPAIVDLDDWLCAVPGSGAVGVDPVPEPVSIPPLEVDRIPNEAVTSVDPRPTEAQSAKSLNEGQSFTSVTAESGPAPVPSIENNSKELSTALSINGDGSAEPELLAKAEDTPQDQSGQSPSDNLSETDRDSLIRSSVAEPVQLDESQAGSSFNSSVMDARSQEEVIDEESKIRERNIAIYEYDSWGLQHRRSTLTDQRIKGWIIFCLVISIVVFGLVLSFIQFRLDILQRTRAKSTKSEGEMNPALKEPANEQETDTNVSDKPVKDTDEKEPLAQEATLSKIKIGLDGLEMSSSILGLLILGFSLGFFYLYLVHVFEIKELGISPSADDIRGLDESTPDNSSDTGTQAESE